MFSSAVMDVFVNNFNKNLARIRKQAGMTQKQLAEKLGVSPAWIGQLETDETVNPSMKTLQKLADALGCKKSDLVGE